MHSLPLIDISSAAAADIEAACRDIGFMYVTGHGIPEAVITDARQAVVDYFSQPIETKQADTISRGNYRGYIPQDFFSPAGEQTDADAYEGYKLHLEIEADHPIVANCDLYGPNKWPAIPGFKRSLLTYWSECDRVAHHLLGELTDSLAVSRDDFLECFALSLTNMTLLHYPPQEEGSDGYGIHPHKDTDALTILSPDPVGGLLVKARDRDEWIHAEPYGDALIVNIGDLMELWSGGYFVSTPHKVINESGAERYSFPYFSVPRFDTVVAPLRERQVGFDREPVHVGDVSREVWRTNWPDAVPDKPEFDLGRLED